MGDLSMGLAYLCGGCCCFKSTDPGPESQGYSSHHRRKHPSERLVEKEFAAREYTRDKDEFGRVRIRYQPTPNSSMMLLEREKSPEKDKENEKGEGKGDREVLFASGKDKGKEKTEGEREGVGAKGQEKGDAERNRS